MKLRRAVAAYDRPSASVVALPFAIGGRTRWRRCLASRDPRRVTAGRGVDGRNFGVLHAVHDLDAWVPATWETAHINFVGADVSRWGIPVTSHGRADPATPSDICNTCRIGLRLADERSLIARSCSHVGSFRASRMPGTTIVFCGTTTWRRLAFPSRQARR